MVVSCVSITTSLPASPVCMVGEILSKKTLTIQGENECILLAQMFGELHDELWFGDGLFCTSDLET